MTFPTNLKSTTDPFDLDPSPDLCMTLPLLTVPGFAGGLQVGQSPRVVVHHRLFIAYRQLNTGVLKTTK